MTPCSVLRAWSDAFSSGDALLQVFVRAVVDVVAQSHDDDFAEVVMRLKADWICTRCTKSWRCSLAPLSDRLDSLRDNAPQRSWSRAGASVWWNPCASIRFRCTIECIEG